MYNSWRFYHPHGNSSIKLGHTLFSEEFQLKPLQPPYIHHCRLILIEFKLGINNGSTLQEDATLHIINPSIETLTLFIQ